MENEKKRFARVLSPERRKVLRDRYEGLRHYLELVTEDAWNAEDQAKPERAR